MISRALLCLSLLLTGCPGFFEEPDPPPVVAPRIVAPQLDAPLVVHVGEPFTVTASVTNADGSPATGYTFSWGGAGVSSPDQAQVVEEHPAPGEEKVTITFLHPGRFNLQAYASVVRENGAAVAHTRLGTIFAWGGPTREILPLTKAVSLAVGEARPVAALAHAQEGPGSPHLRALSHEPLTFAVEDPAVASVDATGVVRGLRPGSTGLTFRVRDVTARIPVTVTARALGAPGEGVLSVDGTVGLSQVEYGARLQTPRGPIEGRLALEPGRNPFTVLGVQPRVASPLLASTLHALVAADWTGTGFGLEWVSDGWDKVKSPQVAIDARGRRYVVYRSEWRNDLVVAERAEAGSPGEWTRRRVPMDLPAARDAGLFTEQYLMNLEDERVALLPRAGGGLWLASWKVLDFREQKPSEYLTEVWDAPATCAQVLQLTEVTDDTLRIEQVAVDWYDVKGNFTQSSCWRRASAVDETRPFLFLLPPLPGDPRPRFISLYGDGETTTLLTPAAGGWTRQDIARPTPRSTGGVAPHELVVVSPERPGEPSVLLSLDTPVSPLPADLWFNAQPGQPQAPYYAYGGSAERQFRYFGFQSQGRLYTGAGFVGPLVRHSPFQGVDRDDPSGSWVPPGGSYDTAWGEQFPMRGLSVQDGWMHVVSESSTGLPLLLARALPGPDARPTDPETQGTRLGAAHATPAVLDAPVVLPDGSRYVLTGTHDAEAKGALLRSGGVGQPFLPRADRDTTPALARATRVWPVGDALRTVSEEGLRLRVHGSTDQGQGWSLQAELPLEDESLIAQHVTPGGAVFGVLRRTSRTNFQVVFSPEGPPGLLTRLPGFPTDRPSPQVITDAAFLPWPSGVLLLVHGPLNDGTAMHDALTLREYDLSGVLVSEKRLELPLVPGEYLSVKASVRTAEGKVLLVSQRSSILVEPVAGTATRSAFPVRMVQDIPPAPLRLPDGRLVLLTTEPVRPRVFHAGYRVSEEGLDWGAFHALRPRGGDNQWILGAAAEADGGLLIGLQDSGGMVPGGAGGGPEQSLLQRVASP